MSRPRLNSAPWVSPLKLHQKDQRENEGRTFSPREREKTEHKSSEEEKHEKRRSLKLSLTLPLPEPLLPLLTELPEEVSVWMQKRKSDTSLPHPADETHHKKFDKEDYLDLMEREKYNFQHFQPLLNFVESCFSCSLQASPRSSEIPPFAPTSAFLNSASGHNTPRSVISSPRSVNSHPSTPRAVAPQSPFTAPNAQNLPHLPFCRLLLFKRGIEPCWEDKHNKAGGNLTLYFSNLEDTRAALFSVLSLLYEDHGSQNLDGQKTTPRSNQESKRPDDFCGLVVSGEYLYLQIWHAKKEKRDEWKRRLERLNLLSKCWKVKYRLHKKCMARNKADDEKGEKKPKKKSKSEIRRASYTEKRSDHFPPPGFLSPRSAYTYHSTETHPGNDSHFSYSSLSLHPPSLKSPREGKSGSNRRLSWHKEHQGRDTHREAASPRQYQPQYSPRTTFTNPKTSEESHQRAIGKPVFELEVIKLTVSKGTDLQEAQLEEIQQNQMLTNIITQGIPESQGDSIVEPERQAENTQIEENNEGKTSQEVAETNNMDASGSEAQQANVNASTDVQPERQEGEGEGVPGEREQDGRQGVAETHGEGVEVTQGEESHQEGESAVPADAQEEEEGEDDEEGGEEGEEEETGEGENQEGETNTGEETKSEKRLRRRMKKKEKRKKKEKETVHRNEEEKENENDEEKENEGEGNENGINTARLMRVTCAVAVAVGLGILTQQTSP